MKRVSFLFLTTGVGFLTLYMLTAVLRQNNAGTLLAEDGTAAYAIIDIGTLGGPSNGAVDINNTGQVVGSSTLSAGEGLAAFLWQEGSVTPLTVSGSETTRALAINDMGQIAGTAISGTGETASQWPVLWTGETATKLATINDADGTARAINNLGLIAGNSITESNNHLLIWQGDCLLVTISISSGVGWANGINDAGHLAGYIDDRQGSSTPFLWRDGILTNLGTLGGSSGKANDINNATQIVGSADINGDLSSHAFLWEDGLMQDLGVLGDVSTASSKANGINNLGMIVGQAQVSEEKHAVLWQGDQIIDLNVFLPPDSAWDVLVTAESINDEGWIAGTGLMDGHERAYILQPLQPFEKIFLPNVAIPEPTPNLSGVKDMADYLIGDGRLYEVQHSSGSQARHQTQFEESRFFHTKGDEVKAEWEELWAKEHFISRGTDTSPGNDQYYTLYRDSAPDSPVGSAWSPRYWKVGETYERNPYVIFYRKSDCEIEASGWHRTWLRFEAFYPQYTFQSGITLNNVIKLAWLLTENGRPEENYFYAENYGLVGWGSQSHGFSYISELHAPCARPHPTREVISCLGKLDESLRYNRELNFGPLPMEYARLVK